MNKEITFNKKVDTTDGSAVRIYTSKGGAIAPENEHAALYIEGGGVEARIVLGDFKTLRELGDTLIEAADAYDQANIS